MFRHNLIIPPSSSILSSHIFFFLFALTQFPDICSDPKQLLYTLCAYVYPSGGQCASPIPHYLTPPLCGGHCDTALSSPPPTSSASINQDNKQPPHESAETTTPTEVATTPRTGEVNLSSTTGKTTVSRSDTCSGSVLEDSSSDGARVGVVKSECGEEDEEEEPMEVVKKETTEKEHEEGEK